MTLRKARAGNWTEAYTLVFNEITDFTGITELSLAAADPVLEPDADADVLGVTSGNEVTNLVSGFSTFRRERQSAPTGGGCFDAEMQQMAA